MIKTYNTLGIDIGSTTVKIAILDTSGTIIFSDYQRHYANIQETLASIIQKAFHKLGNIEVSPVITGSGGLTLSKHLNIPCYIKKASAISLLYRSDSFMVIRTNQTNFPQ